MALAISFAFNGLKIYFPESLVKFDNTLKDFMFKVRGVKETDQSVVIVDIDEKSLDALGQWPWSRDKFAEILVNLTNAGVGVIGLDIVFAEEDRTSPDRIAKQYNLDTTNLPNYDEILAYTVANTPTIMGYQFELGDKEYTKTEPPSLPAIFIERNKQEGEQYLIKGNGIIKNHDLLQENSYSSGFFNNIPDESGIVRSVPLVIEYDGELFASLALETIRAAMGINRVFVNYSEQGVENIQIGDFKIPTDRHGRMIINFRGGEGTFKYISALDIYNNTFDPAEIEGKVILIGTSAAGLKDLRAIPFDSVYPGVEVHANIIDNIILKDFITIPNWVEGLELILIFAISIVAVLLMTYSPFWLNPIIITTLLGGYFYFSYYMLFTEGILMDLITPLVLIVTAGLVTTFLDYVLEIKNEQAIKKKFASKVSPQVMEDILNQEGENTFAAQEKEITVFFSDVRNFTNISEAMPNASVLIEFLNEYMDPMTDIIIQEKGTVDKFIGDAIMAYWNAPGNVPDHAERAVIATLEQLHRIDDLNTMVRADSRFEAVVAMADKSGVPVIDIGIGLNTGVSVVGEMGSTQRSDYTVIGDPVNLGARLESLCKYYNSKCNISGFTKSKLEGNYIYRFLDLVTVKGKSEPIEIWQIHDYDRDETHHKLFDVSKERLFEELDIYHKAVDLYKNANFKEALEIFKDINSWEDKSNKNIYDIYIERCEHYIEMPPTDFNGVFKHTSKG